MKRHDPIWTPAQSREVARTRLRQRLRSAWVQCLRLGEREGLVAEDAVAELDVLLRGVRSGDST